MRHQNNYAAMVTQQHIQATTPVARIATVNCTDQHEKAQAFQGVGVQSHDISSCQKKPFNFFGDPTVINTNEIPFKFSFGDRSEHSEPGKPIPTNRPVQCSSPNWDDFAEVFNQTRAPEKTRQFVCAPFEGKDGFRVNGTWVSRRAKSNVKPRRWIGLDLDALVCKTRTTPEVPLSDEKFAEICEAAHGIGQGLYYETSSSKPGDRCARFVFALDVELPRGAAQAVSRFIQSLLPEAGWDATVYKGEQPLYLPPEGVTVHRIEGKPINVAAIAKDVIRKFKPAPRAPIVPLAPSQARHATLAIDCLRQIGLHVKHKGGGKHEIICPWGDLHSDGRLEAVYFEPSASNGGTGGFKCLHSHCEHRHIGHLLEHLERFGNYISGVRHAA